VLICVVHDWLCLNHCLWYTEPPWSVLGSYCIQLHVWLWIKHQMAVGCMCVPGVRDFISVWEIVSDLQKRLLPSVDCLCVSNTVTAGAVVDISGHVEIGKLTVLGSFAYYCWVFIDPHNLWGSSWLGSLSHAHTLFWHCSSQTCSVLIITFECCEVWGRLLMIGSLPSSWFFSSCCSPIIPHSGPHLVK